MALNVDFYARLKTHLLQKISIHSHKSPVERCTKSWRVEFPPKAIVSTPRSRRIPLFSQPDLLPRWIGS